MNENINLVEILKDCPEGTILYSTVFGEVTLKTVKTDGRSSPIEICTETDSVETYMANGKLYNNDSAECTLFPSKDQRDWNNFQGPVKHKKFKPFEKVLVIEYEDGLYAWTVAFYSHWNERLGLHVTAGGYHYNDEDILPYKSNEDLVGKKTGLEQ